jgi:hypothetical protein
MKYYEVWFEPIPGESNIIYIRTDRTISSTKDIFNEIKERVCIKTMDSSIREYRNWLKKHLNNLTGYSEITSNEFTIGLSWFVTQAMNEDL